MKQSNDRSNIGLKILQLLSPINILSHNPLNGAYNDINNIEDSQTYPLQQQMKNFDMSNLHFPGYSHMLAINKSLGKVIVGEYFTSLIIIHNSYLSQYTKISLPKITKKIDNIENNVTYITLSNSKNKPSPYSKEIIISPNDIEILKISELINKHSLFHFSISFNITPYDPPREGNKDRKIISKQITCSKSFKIPGFEPFSIKEKFYNVQMKKWYIELRIENISKTKLMINNIEVLSEVKVNGNQLMLKDENNENILLQSDECFNCLLSTDNMNGFLSSPMLNVNINWRNMFDPCLKVFNCMLKNVFYNVDNNYFKLIISEAPNTVQYGNVFKVIFEIVNKTVNELQITIDVEGANELDVLDDKAVEIIDIVERKMVITKKNGNTKKFCMICKSNIIGKVFLPTMKIQFDKQNYFTYNKLLCFDCTEEINLLI